MGNRVLILTSDMGFGHRSAAKAVQAALLDAYECEVTIVNPLEHQRAPDFLRNTQSDYDRLVKQWPNIYKLGYQVMDAPLSSVVIESAFAVMLFEAMRDLLKTHTPDVIVTTHHSYLAPLDALFNLSRKKVPLITVVTDLATVQRSWFHEVTDYTLVPTRAVQDLALEAELNSEQVRIIGIPVNPRFANEMRPKSELRAQLGWQPDLLTVLAVGSKRVAQLYDAVNTLNHSGFPLQLAVVAGGDDDLYAQFLRTEWHIPTHVYNLVEDMPAMMHAADCILCKAGGLVVTEALSSGLPILLTDVIHGQETGNADYVTLGGAGDLAEDGLAVLQTMCHWLANDRRIFNQRSAAARTLGRPRAAYEVAALVWQLAQEGAPKRVRHDNELRWRDIFNSFDRPITRDDLPTR
jgi:1,2-diacylglycerol 3-beta-galactosyltransferase